MLFGHFQAFVLTKEWECGLLSPPFYLISLLEREKAAQYRKELWNKADVATLFPSQPQGRIFLYYYLPSRSHTEKGSCLTLVEGCLASKQHLHISHCSAVGRLKAAETSSNNWYQLPFVSLIVFIWNSYIHWAENQSSLIKSRAVKAYSNDSPQSLHPPAGTMRIRKNVFSVLEGALTGQPSRELAPSKASVTGTKRGKASLGAALLPWCPLP